MKQIARFGSFVLAVFAFASAQHVLFAQRDQTAHLYTAALNQYMNTSSQHFTEGPEGSAQRHGTTILVRKNKPRSTQPTRIQEVMSVRTGSGRECVPEYPDRRTMRLRIVKSGLIISVTDLKHLHSLNDRKIFSVFNQYRNFFTA